MWAHLVTKKVTALLGAVIFKHDFQTPTLFWDPTEIITESFFSSKIWCNWYNFSHYIQSKSLPCEQSFLMISYPDRVHSRPSPRRQIRNLSSQKLSKFGLSEIIIKITWIRFLAEPCIQRCSYFHLNFGAWNWNCLKHRMSMTSVTRDHGSNFAVSSEFTWEGPLKGSSKLFTFLFILSPANLEK